MIYIAVCEDEPEHQEKISAFLKKYGVINCCDFEICFFSTAADFWNHYQPVFFNIVFLDIYLDNDNGIEIGTKLRNLGEDCQMVFITSSRDFAIEGFELKTFSRLRTKASTGPTTSGLLSLSLVCPWN